MLVFVSLIVIIVTLFVYYMKKKFSYWDNLGVPFIKPKFPFGNLQSPRQKNRVHSSLLMQRYYNEIKGRNSFGGIYFFWQPLALIVDLELVKQILVKDFQSFHDRGMYFNEKDDPISAHLFNIEGDRWTNLRKKLTPTFSSGKMKMMFPTLVDVGHHFIDRMTKDIETSPEIEMKDILARFTTDVIGSCAFGIDCNSLNDPDTEFRRMGKKVFEIPSRTFANFLKFPFMLSFKDFSRKIGLKSTSEDVSEFFMKVVKDTLEYREANNVQRNDFMNLLMQIKNTGKLEGSDEDVGKLSFNEIAAQAFVFFLAGFETSSTTMTFCLHELSLNEEIQDRARKCALEAIEKHGGLTYEAVMDMHYIEQCINESLRKFPPGANLQRCASKDFKIPGTDFTFKKGQSIWIPVYAIQHDPDYWPEPEKYDPDRFLPDEMGKRNPYSFIPFGEGPRNCIGIRFGMLEARLGLAMLLTNFKFGPSDKTKLPLEISTKNFVMSPNGGLWLTVEKLDI